MKHAAPKWSAIVLAGALAACQPATDPKAEAAAQAAAQADAEAREHAEKARVARVIEDEAARKAARDQRYANRKARQG